MPAKNLHHDAVVEALRADGWTITHDPLTISYGSTDLFVDLAAERRSLAAERDGRLIAVEIQSFISSSPIRDLEEAVGQYGVYRIVLAETEPQRELFLAVPERVYDGVLTEELGQLVVARLHLKLLVFSDASRKVVRWIE